LAQKSAEDVKDEARERFDRGLRLFNQQDNEGALAEFTQAYQLVPHALVLYNIGLVHAALGRPVKAVEAFDRLLTAPSGLDPAKLERIRAERAQQASLIAEIEVSTPVNAALVEVDGVEAGKTPLAGPLRVAGGTHVVGVIAPGYAPLRKSVTAAGATRTRLVFELLPQEAQLAHLEVRTRLPKVQVLVDGEPLGVTPLPASLALAPGQRRIELKRPGYVTASQTVTLGPGSTGAITLEPVVDPAALNQDGGVVALTISEPGAVVFVDGESRGPYTGPLRLPAGEHQLRVERGEFFPSERKVDVPLRGQSSIRIDLEPTPEKRTRYRNSAQARRTWGWVATGSGAALLAGGTGFLLWNAGEKSDKEKAWEAQEASNTRGGGGECDPTTVTDRAACEEALFQAVDNLDAARKRDVFGWVGIGVGAAAVGTGLFLLLGGDDPNRYEPKAESDVFGLIELTPRAWLLPGTGGFALNGRF
jgi:hypothetical protein